MTETLTRDPKVWIGCLAAYNEGTLHGEWVTVPEDADDLWAEIKRVLSTSPALHAEEWFFADNEDFHPWNPGEWPTISKLVMAAQLIREKGAAAAGWIDNDSSVLDTADDYADLEERFDEAFAGTWESDEDFAREWVESCGLPSVGVIESKVLDELDRFLDWDAIADDVLENYHVVKADDELHYFRADV